MDIWTKYGKLVPNVHVVNVHVTKALPRVQIIVSINSLKFFFKEEKELLLLLLSMAASLISRKSNI